MKKSLIIMGIAALISASALSGCGAVKENTSATIENNKQTEVSTMNKDKAIELLETSIENGKELNIARIIDGGDYISIHSQITEGDKNAAQIDIYHFDNGEVIEHITNSQDMPDEPNPSGHTMLDGWTEQTDEDKTEENTEIVTNLLDAMMNGNAEALPTFFDGDNYINHNPQAYDGVSGFAKGMEERRKAGIITKYDRVALVFGAGNFVQTVTEGSKNDVPMLFFDIFRVENGKVAEHWDVVAEKK